MTPKVILVIFTIIAKDGSQLSVLYMWALCAISLLLATNNRETVDTIKHPFQAGSPVSVQQFKDLISVIKD